MVTGMLAGSVDAPVHPDHDRPEEEQSSDGSLQAAKDEITPADLPSDITSYPRDKKFIPELTSKGIDVDEIIGNIEKRYLTTALDLVGGVKTEAAKLLNLSFRSFRHRLQKYGIK